MKKVAILGATPSRAEAPLTDPTWAVWGCNSLWPHTYDAEGRFRATAWFELHPLSVQTEEELRAIRSCPVPIYLLREPPADVPTGVRYPVEAVEEALALPGGRTYWTCTFAYQIALALYQDFTTIGLYGVDLSLGTPRERTAERACTEFWLGVALGRGVEVVLPDEDSLLWAPHKYGFDYDEEKDDTDRWLAHLASLVRYTGSVDEARVDS